MPTSPTTVINTNILALQAQRRLTLTGLKLGKAIERLSTGLRINRAADDAAGLSMSTRMDSQITGLQRGMQNVQDAISLIQTAEGGIEEITGILQRMRQLAVQAATDTLTAEQRQSIKEELDRLSESLTQIAQNTKYNTLTLLDGSVTIMTVQFGANTNEVKAFPLTAMTAGALGVSLLTVSSLTFAQAAITAIDTAIGTVSAFRAQLGAHQNAFERLMANVSTQVENLTQAVSRIRDLDIAEETVNYTRLQILQQSGTAVLAQAVQLPAGVLNLLR
jgi:flagellin